jgi:hypothetical protein
VRKQLACSGFAVRWKRLFDALTSIVFRVSAFTCSPSCLREPYASPSRSTTRFLSQAPRVSPRQWWFSGATGATPAASAVTATGHSRHIPRAYAGFFYLDYDDSPQCDHADSLLLDISTELLVYLPKKSLIIVPADRSSSA